MKYLSKIDLTKGYWQIPVAPEDVYKTAFVTPDRQYEFLRMPFGMVNTGATLVRGLKKVLQGLSGVGSYIDDIVIYSDSWEEHLRTLKELFGRLRRARITAQHTKCLLGANRMEFLGHQIGSDVITPSSDNLEKVRKTPRLTTKKQVRSFLGLVGLLKKTTSQLSPRFQLHCLTSSRKESQSKYNGRGTGACLLTTQGAPATRKSTEAS